MVRGGRGQGTIMCQARLAKAADENILDKWQSIQ